MSTTDDDTPPVAAAPDLGPEQHRETALERLERRIGESKRFLMHDTLANDMAADLAKVKEGIERLRDQLENFGDDDKGTLTDLLQLLADLFRGLRDVEDLRPELRQLLERYDVQ